MLLILNIVKLIKYHESFNILKALINVSAGCSSSHSWKPKDFDVCRLVPVTGP